MSKTFLFAGASSGIAVKTAEILREKGYKIIGISKSNPVEHYDICYNVENYEAESLPDINEPINGIAYFPGTINLKPFSRLTKKDFINDYEINALGAVYFIQKYLPQLKQIDQASVVLMSSVAVKTGLPFHGSISMAKGAVEGLVKSLAAEFSPQIRVNAVAPSLTATVMGSRLLNTPEKYMAAQQRNPMKKVGTPLEVATVVSFLLDSTSSWITGHILPVDGGMNNIRLN